MQEKEQGENQ
jgi:hypothetical protein